MRRLVVASLALVLSACMSDQTSSPTGLDKNGLPIETAADDTPGFTSPFFFWLPPTVAPAPSFNGVFDATRRPDVVICRISGGVCAETIVRLEIGFGLEVDPAEEVYRGLWLVSDYDPEVGEEFRITVSEASVSFSVAQIAVVDKALGKLKHGSDGTQIFLNENNGKRALDIRFRIELGAPSPYLNPTNGHYYEAIPTEGGLSWVAAEAAAASLRFASCAGHLASITSQGEQDFIVSTFPEAVPVGRLGYWVGGIQPPGSPEPAGGWTWVTGEPFGPFTFWAAGEPNNIGGEDALHLNGKGTGAGEWNDIPSTTNQHRIPGYVVEYDTPCSP